RVTKKQNVRRYSQIDDLCSPAFACIKKGLLSTLAHDQKDGNMAKDETDLLTVREVAKQLRVDDRTVRRWIKNGVLEAISLPHRGARQAYRIRRSTLDTLLGPSTQPVSH